MCFKNVSGDMFMGWIRWKVPRCWVICIIIAEDKEMFLSIVIGIFDDLECWLSDDEFFEIKMGFIIKKNGSFYQAGSGRTFIIAERYRCNKRCFCYKGFQGSQVVF